MFSVVSMLPNQWSAPSLSYSISPTIFDTVVYFVYFDILLPLAFGRQQCPPLFFFQPTDFLLLLFPFLLNAEGLKRWPIFSHWVPFLSSLFCIQSLQHHCNTAWVGSHTCMEMRAIKTRELYSVTACYIG